MEGIQFYLEELYVFFLDFFVYGAGDVIDKSSLEELL